MTKQTRRWAQWPAICLAALSILAFSSTADAQRGRGREGAGRRPPASYDRGRTYDPAYANGRKDGYAKGREDARDGDRFDARRHSRYRSGTHGYKSRYGPRTEYKRFYRDGFADGYARGYRDGLRTGRGRWNNRGPWWRY